MIIDMCIIDLDPQNTLADMHFNKGRLLKFLEKQ